MKRNETLDQSDGRELAFTDMRANPFAKDRSRNLRVLAPDLLDVFPDSESVNEALRTLVRLTSASRRRGNTKTTAVSKTKR